MNTEKHDYRLLEMGDMEYYGARMTATFFDRRFEVYGAIYSGGGKLKSIRDQDGNVIIESRDPHQSTGRTMLMGTRLDLTDDYTDPRSGIRFDVTRSQSSAENSEPNYYIMDYNTTAYVPLGRRSTWAFNFLRSDAVVLRTGETNTLALQNQQGLICSTITDPADRQFCDEVFENMAASNKYGTATQLGGFSRLRSYPQGRFRGAHTLFFGTEIRWNLTDERTPYNIFIMKDVRTAVQVAVFYETGSTADVRSELGDIWRDSYGLGLRVVTASGIVFRGDMAFGKEGFEPEIFIGYPWEL
jgi:outer membrane protein assembly factor BamA